MMEAKQQECKSGNQQMDAAFSGKPGLAASAADWLGVSLILATLTAFFYKAIFTGKTVSKLGLLHEVDALYNPALKQAMVPLTCDPSGYLIFYPFGNFAQQCWSNLVVPLWNPFIGCGYPLCGDPQSFIFSLAHLAGLYSSPSAYGAGLLLEIFLGAIGLFCFARYLRLSVIASCFAAVSFALTPRNLTQVDLSGAECFYPWVFLVFAWMADRPGLFRILAAAAVVAASAYASHPETALFCALFAAIYAFCSSLFKRAGALNHIGKEALQAHAQKQERSWLWTVMQLCIAAIKAPAAAGLIAIGLAAPLILPFVEFFQNSFFYKDTATGASFISPLQFCLSYFTAGGAESCFPGSVALLLLPLGAMIATKRQLPLVVTSAICLAVTVPPPFMVPLLSCKPLSYLATLYAMPELLMFLALLAACGFDYIGRERLSKLQLFSFAAVTTAIAASPPVIAYNSCRTNDQQLVNQAITESRSLIHAITYIAIAAGMIICLRSFGKKRGSITDAVTGKAWYHLPVLLLAALNIASLALVTKHALPAREQFNPPSSPVIAAVAAANGRFVATGTNFLLPNTSSMYRIYDIRSFNPLLPYRYKRLITECGAITHNLYFQNFPDRTSPLLDLAGVKTIVTRAAACAERDWQQDCTSAVALVPCKLAKGVRLVSGKLHYDGQNKQIDGDISFTVEGNAANRFALQYCIFDQTGREIWLSKQKMLCGDPYSANRTSEAVHVPIPSRDGAQASRAALAIRVSDTWTGINATRADSKANEHSTAGSVLLAEFKLEQQPRPAGSRQLRLIEEYACEGVRIYENTGAIPAGFLMAASKAHLTRNAQESLQTIKDIEFDPRERACIEIPPEQQALADIASGAPAGSAGLSNLGQPVQLIRPNCNTVIATVSTEIPSFLILTDLYYPGWHCTVDGKRTDIYPANYAFRAVKIPPGTHSVRFEYWPTSLSNGLLIAAITLLSLACVAAWRKLKCS